MEGNVIGDIGEAIVGGFVLTVIAVLLILVLSTFGNAVAPLPGGSQASNITGLGIMAIVTIVGIAGIAGFVKFIQIIIEALDGISGGFGSGL